MAMPMPMMLMMPQSTKKGCKMAQITQILDEGKKKETKANNNNLLIKATARQMSRQHS